MNIKCPSCKTDELILVGNVPQWSIFAGNKLEMQLQANLYKCRECNLFFKYPRPSKEQLDELYKNANPEHWQYNLMKRDDWQIAIRFINNNMSKGTILDIGCWNGEFLSYMEAGWKCYGTEINQFASEIAEDKGVDIIEGNFDNLVSPPIKFNVVTAFNVLEHAEDPLSFIKMMSKVTNEKGLIIISTGNTGVLTWKLTKKKNYYCALPEHLSFINISWLHSVADKLNFQIEHLEKFSAEGKNRATRFLLDTIKNVAYLVSPDLLERLKKLKRWALHGNDTGNIDPVPPSWKSSKDQLIVIFRVK